jgi:hypothetical protein
MKVRQNITVAAMALTLLAGVALATAADTKPVDAQQRGPGYGMMNGDHGCSMANGGQRMGRHGMMGKGPGMRHGAAMNPEMREKRNQFLDATVELRKKINDKEFAYKEAQRNTELTLGELQKQADELFALRQQLKTKRQSYFVNEPEMVE